MTLLDPLIEDIPCECGFSLWQPISQSKIASLGLYDDARFPGRSILRLKEHYESLEEVPVDVLVGFMQDVQAAMTAIRIATGASRVNVAILGNRDPHVHAHLIPRFPKNEEFPDCSPWNDMRTKTALSLEKKEQVILAIRQEVENLPKESRFSTVAITPKN